MTVDEQSLRLAARFARCAGFDAATGLPNLRHFLVALERELARARRRREPVAVLVVEAAPDAPIAEWAVAVAAQVRSEDVLARIGERRLGILVTAHEPAAARRIAKRLHDAIDPPPAGVGVRLVLDGAEQDAVRVLADAVTALDRTLGVQHRIDLEDGTLLLA